MKYHLIAALTTAIWGTTLVSSKILLQAGMTPAEILFSRLVLAYVFLWLLYPHLHKPQLHDELVFAVSGIFGGTIYFLTENTALQYTSATNLSLICATVPVATAIASQLILHEKHITRCFITGSVISLTGVILVILNGAFVLKLSPVGDLLGVLSVISWSLYCVSLKKLKSDFNSLYVIRRVFFYSILTLAPVFLFRPYSFPLSGFKNVEVFSNIVFLGLIASSFCYYMWTIAIKKIGVVSTNSYIYIMPIVTVVTANVFLSEKITVYVVIGAVLIIGGLVLTRLK